MTKASNKAKVTTAPAAKAVGAGGSDQASQVEQVQVKAQGNQPEPVAIRIISRQDGFRRCGRVFGKEPVDIPLEALEDEEVERLLADPMLSCAFLGE